MNMLVHTHVHVWINSVAGSRQYYITADGDKYSIRFDCDKLSTT